MRAVPALCRHSLRPLAIVARAAAQARLPGLALSLAVLLPATAGGQPDTLSQSAASPQLISAALPAATGPVRIVDEAGRTVELRQPARRIVLSESPDYVAVSLIDPEPAARIVAWNKWRLDPAVLEALRAGDPRFDAIEQMSINGPDALPIERLIALASDLVVLHPRYLVNPLALRRLEAAGIPVAVLNVSPAMRRPDPLAGLRRLAVLLGRSEAAEAYAAFFEARVAQVRARVADVDAERRPTVLLEPHAGNGPCCLSVGDSENIGDLVRVAGGRPIGDDVITGMVGRVSLEYVLARDPDVYVGVGGPHLARQGGLVLGVGTQRAEVEASLRKVVARRGMAALSAVRHGRVHGFWFPIASGVNIVAIEALATWLYPERFADLDPERTMDEINRRFLATPLHGVFTVSLPKPAAGRP